MAWVPAVGTTWQWQLQGAIDVNVNASVFDVDVLVVDQQNPIPSIKAVDPTRKVICYVNVAALETNGVRSDFSQFLDSDKGSVYPGWLDEVFLDIRSQNVRRIMEGRFVAAQAAGCDAIEPDNIGLLYQQNSTGFATPVTEQDEVEYIRWLQDKVHTLGMSIGCKNSGDLIDKYPDLVDGFEFAVVESCATRGECGVYHDRFVQQKGKAVLDAEYSNAGSDGGCDATQDAVAACSELKSLQISGIIKDCGLNAAITQC